MHASSLENMQRCYQEFLGTSSLLHKPLVRVLDIGGANINGSYSDIFSDEKFQYVAVDLAEGEGVDLVLDNPYQLPFQDAEFDVVISGQVFEHAEFFWKLFEEIVRVMSLNGFIFLIVPSSGPIHRYPVDCYRFYPDAMQALANYTGLNLDACWLDDRGPWNDLVGVFSHNGAAKSSTQVDARLPVNRFMAQMSVAPLFDIDANPDVDVISGEMLYLDLLCQIHAVVQPRHYLEIGVRQGRSLSLANCLSIAVDPEPDLSFDLPSHQVLFKKSSDAFFHEDATSVLSDKQLDLAFIDGMHLFEFALRDFINIERYSLATSLVVIDDIYPNHPIQAERKRRSRVWTGDIWKLHDCLRRIRPDLVLIPIDTAPTGLLLVAGLNSANRTLSDQYNPLVRKYRNLPLDDSELEILGRQDALAPDDVNIEILLQAIREERNKPQAGFNLRLKQLLSH